MQLAYVTFLGLISLFAVVAVGVVRSWLAWLAVTTPGQKTTWRSGLTFIALLSVSVAILAVIGFALHSYILGGFGNNFRPIIIWFRVGFWLCVVAFVSSVLGRERTWRVTCASSIVVGAFWVAVAFAM